MQPNRRQFLALTAALAACPARAAGGIAVVDWALLETVLALGVTPVAAAELRQYARVVGEPAVPASVVDIGLRGNPNLELLSTLAPDLIVISNFYDYRRLSSERIAEVLSLPVYLAGQPCLPLLRQSTRDLGRRLGHADRAESLVTALDASIAAVRQARRPDGRPAMAVNLGDRRHVRLFGADTLFGGVLTAAGYRNGFADTRYSMTAPAGIEVLARDADAELFVIGPLPAGGADALAGNALWQALPQVAAGRVHVLPSLDHFGGLPTATRFAALLAAAGAPAR
ncbi:MAG: amino acid transporter substrate-binding protein [Proteobacteria bacterium]|nr:amino acid transporter substrate-binding protein [Pseudomonadota bacterium]